MEYLPQAPCIGSDRLTRRRWEKDPRDVRRDYSIHLHSGQYESSQKWDNLQKRRKQEGMGAADLFRLLIRLHGG
jgi:hypothetical protein